MGWFGVCIDLPARTHIPSQAHIMYTSRQCTASFTHHPSTYSPAPSSLIPNKFSHIDPLYSPSFSFISPPLASVDGTHGIAVAASGAAVPVVVVAAAAAWEDAPEGEAEGEEGV